eukprot:symbB.v1.2.020277.t1/scaffold1692.1/size111236/6
MALLGLTREEPLALRPSAINFELRRPVRSTSLGAVRPSSSTSRQDSPAYRRALDGENPLRARSSAGVREHIGPVSRSHVGRVDTPPIVPREAIAEPTSFVPVQTTPLTPLTPPPLMQSSKALELEARAQQRQRNWGTLSSSWLVKNCFSAWRSFVQAQVTAARAQMQQDLQLSVVLELQASLAKKDEEIKRLLAEMRRNQQTSLNRLTLQRNAAADASLRSRVFSAWRWTLERKLREALERLEAELRTVQMTLRVTNEELSSLQVSMLKAREARREALDQRMSDEQILKARVLELWQRVVLARRKESASAQVAELEEALREAEHQMRRSENEWHLKYQQLEKEWKEKLRKAKEDRNSMQ